MNIYILCFLIRAGPSPPLIRAMPERKHFFLMEVFPYGEGESTDYHYGDGEYTDYVTTETTLGSHLGSSKSSWYVWWCG